MFLVGGSSLHPDEHLKGVLVCFLHAGTQNDELGEPAPRRQLSWVCARLGLSPSDGGGDVRLPNVGLRVPVSKLDQT